MNELPSQAALKRIQVEETFNTPTLLAKTIHAVRALLSGDIAGSVDAFRECNEEIVGDRERYLLEWIIHDLGKLATDYESLSAAQRRYMETDWVFLLQTAQQNAHATRQAERIRRIAAILTGSIVEPIRPPDETDELMGIAMNLSDEDVVVLLEVRERQHRWERNQTTQPSLFAPTDLPGIAPERALSILAKLTSLGLIIRAEDRTQQLRANTFPGGGGVFILATGARFLRALSETPTTLDTPG